MGWAGVQPVLTLTLPMFCCRSNTRCGPRSLWGEEAGEYLLVTGVGSRLRPNPYTNQLTAAQKHC